MLKGCTGTLQIGADVLAEQLENLALPNYHGEAGTIWLNVTHIGCRGLRIHDVRYDALWGLFL
jgi:hypothetical protein